jgi:hypothetical protein
MRNIQRIVLFTSVMCGCSPNVGYSLIQSADTAVVRDPTDREETQGTSLVGAGSDGEPERVWKVSLPNHNYKVWPGSGVLARWAGWRWVQVGAGDSFTATANGTEVKLTISQVGLPQNSSDERVRTMDPSNRTLLYTVQMPDGSSFCKPDRYGSVQAIVQQGYFDEKGALHTEEANVFTFGCLSGVIGKCAKWKYLPWEVSDLHWSCTRAARADYCGTGEPHTFDNTPIDIYDSLNPPRNVADAATPPDAPHVDYESAWTTAGAFCVTGPRWPQLIDKEGKQLCGVSSPIIDQATGNPYLCRSFDWAQNVVEKDRGLKIPLIAIDSNHGPLPQ